MFKKPGPSIGKGVLEDRVRRLSASKPALNFEKVLVPQKQDARAPRQPVFRHGALVFEDGRRLSVVIKNLSTTGARIEFFVRTSLPDTMVLTEPTLPLKCRARVVWQREGVAGLRFIER